MNNMNNQNEDPEEIGMRRRRRNILIVMAEIVVCLLLCISVYGVNILNSFRYEELDKDVYVETTSVPKPHKGKEVDVEVDAGELTGYRNILVLGLDARSQFNFDDGAQSDVMMVVSVNNDTGEIKLVSILRDTIMKMEEGTSKYAYNKANAQFAVSGISDTVSMVNRNLGLDIGEYVIVNWYGVATAINQLGGIELTIPNETILKYFNGYLTFTNEATGIWAPQLTAPGTYLMSGTQVVAFCRIRYGGYNDEGRASNQREVIEKVFEKCKKYLEAGDINLLMNVAETALSNVKTNMTLPEILYTASELSNYKMAGSTQFPKEYTTAAYLGNYPAKYNCIDPIVANDFAKEVKDLHTFLFNDPNYEPSEFIKNISYQMTQDRLGQ